jgi:uncharacterized RDD family membrane protein YckC
MTREEQLRFCKICTKQKFDLQQGIICSLTNKNADFEDKCEWFEEDTSITQNDYLSEFDINMDGKAASQKQRFINFMIDSLCLFVINLVLGIVIGLILITLDIDISPLFGQQNALSETLTNYLLGAIAGTFYYSLFEANTGRSIGKYITKTKVVTEKGDKPKFKAILIRSLCRSIPFDALSFLGSDASGWHDSISKTKVVEV